MRDNHLRELVSQVDVGLFQRADDECRVACILFETGETQRPGEVLKVARRVLEERRSTIGSETVALTRIQERDPGYIWTEQTDAEIHESIKNTEETIKRSTEEARLAQIALEALRDAHREEAMA